MKTVYTVTFRHTDGRDVVSRFFSTKAAARKWLAYLCGLSYVAEVSLYRGPAGAELLDRKAA